MKQKLNLVVIILYLILIGNKVSAQNPSLALTADSLASGNYKDVLKSFFQLSFNRLTSSDKEIQFTSNPFAVMAKMNPDLLVDTNYIKYTHLRNLNFSFAGKLDSAYRFNGFSSGIKYALINQRDETVSRAFLISAFNANDEYNKLNKALDAYISNISPDPTNPNRMLFRDQKTKMFRGQDGFDELDTSFSKNCEKLGGKFEYNKFLEATKPKP